MATRWAGSERSEQRGQESAVKAPVKRTKVVRLKLVSAGDASTGKSCLIKRYCEQRFLQRYVSTIGVDFGVRTLSLGSASVRVDLWDLAGGECYKEVRNELYSETSGALLVFDCTSRQTFQTLGSWLNEMTGYGMPLTAPIAVVCNKIDAESSRTVKANEARSWAQRNGFWYFETSAATGSGVDALFSTMFALMLKSTSATPWDTMSAAAGEAASKCSAAGDSHNALAVGKLISQSLNSRSQKYEGTISSSL